MKSTTSVVSQAASIAQSTASQVDVKLRSNQTKAKLRTLLRNIDAEKSGQVKEQAFFTILALHGIKLSDGEKSKLKKQFTRAGLIKYADALQAVSIDLDSAVLNEEKWTLQQQQNGKAQEAQNSLLPGKAVSHLSRMSLAEFNERQAEMKQEVLDTNAGDAYGYGQAGEQQPRNMDSASKAGSSVSRPVLQQNMDQLHEFRSQLGLIQKSRPKADYSATVDASVTTPLLETSGQELDRLSTNAQIVAERDVAAPTSASNKFVAALQKKDRELFDKLVALMFFFNQLDIDVRLVAQLRSCFGSKDNMEACVPIAAFKASVKSVFGHYRQVDEISKKICECVKVQGEIPYRAEESLDLLDCQGGRRGLQIDRQGTPLKAVPFCSQKPYGISGQKQDMADAGRLASMIEFMRCYPGKVNRDKNNSSGMNYVMHTDVAAQRDTGKPSQQQPKLAIIQPQAEVDYVKHLVSMVLTRMEDKHRNQTEIFRFLDQRGKGRVTKKDFQSAVERLRISLARDDITKVWNYIDASQQGFIQLNELSVAFANRVSNFGKTIETAVERRAVDSYKIEQNAQIDSRNMAQAQQTSPESGVSKALKAQRDQYKVHIGARSPIVTKSLEHTFGAKNLPSDEIGAIVGNVYMEEAALVTKAKNDAFAQQRAAIPKGLKCKQTLTSMMRKDVGKQVADQYDAGRQMFLEQSSAAASAKRTSSVYKLGKPSLKVLPPLQRAPGSRRGFSKGLPSSQSGTLNLSEVDPKGTLNSGPVGHKPAGGDRVLFPTHVKESFLMRNKHVAHAKMYQMHVDIADFAKRSGL